MHVEHWFAIAAPRLARLLPGLYDEKSRKNTS